MEDADGDWLAFILLQNDSQCPACDRFSHLVGKQPCHADAGDRRIDGSLVTASRTRTEIGMKGSNMSASTRRPSVVLVHGAAVRGCPRIKSVG